MYIFILYIIFFYIFIFFNLDIYSTGKLPSFHTCPPFREHFTVSVRRHTFTSYTFPSILMKSLLLALVPFQQLCPYSLFFIVHPAEPRSVGMSKL